MTRFFLGVLVSFLISSFVGGMAWASCNPCACGAPPPPECGHGGGTGGDPRAKTVSGTLNALLAQVASKDLRSVK